MPYALSLQTYVLPEFYTAAPESWEQRLREISPVTPNLAHLRFRKFEPRADWLWPDRPIWAVYSCTPRHLVHPDKANEFAKHWSELPLHPEKDHPECEQMAQRALISDYQHFMWHTQGLSVRPFWLLQGEWGGTPTKYTTRERRYLDGSGLLSEAFPIGYFPACPFDERAVKGILARDRLMQAGMRFDALEKMDRPAERKAEDDAAEFMYRETVLDTLAILNRPAIEFMQSQRGKAEITANLPPAPKGLENKLGSFREVYKETGRWQSTTTAPMKKVHASALVVQ